MATSIEEILGKQINSVKDLRNEIKNLQDELVRMEAGTNEWNETTHKLVSAQDALNKVTRAGKADIDANATSIVGLEKEYKNLYNAYKLLSEEERNSPFGVEMASRLKEVSEQLNDTKKNVGNFTANIGHYSESAVDAFNQMGISVGGLIQPLTNVKSAFGLLNKTMLANPVMWLLGGLMLLKGIFDKVKGAIAGNEETQNRLNLAMAKFQPILNSISNAFDALGTKVVGFIEKLSNAYVAVVGFIDNVKSRLGLGDEEETLTKAVEVTTDLEKRTQDLEKAKRKNLNLNKQQEAELKILLTEAEATTNQTEKLEKLNQAKLLQEEITKRQIEEAEEEFAIMSEKAELTANSAEDNQKLAETEARVNQVRAEGASKLKEITTKITTLTTAVNKSNTALDEHKENLEKIADIENRVNENLNEDNYEYHYQKRKEQYEKEIELYKQEGKDITNLTKEYQKDIKELWDKFEKQREEREATSFKLIITQFLLGVTEKRKEFNSFLLETTDKINNELVKKNPDFNLIQSLEDEIYKKRKELLELEQETYGLKLAELNLKKGTVGLTEEEEQTRLEFEIKYYETKDELRQLDLNREIKATKTREELLQREYEAKMNNANSILNYLDSFGALNKEISNILKDNLQQQIKEGKLTEEQAEKKKKALKGLQAVQLAVSIATIAGDTAVGITNLWQAYAKKKALNNQLIALPAIASANALDLASTIAQTAGMATMATAQIAAATGSYISATRSIGEMGMSGASATPNTISPNTIDTTAYSYTRELQTEEEVKENKAPIIVYVEDIKRALEYNNKVNVETTY